jgi:DNA-binding response OmpR family regulator/DNA-binding CsgD family transcriptional regulator
MNPHDAESTILLVDDNPANLTLLVEQLLAQGFQLMVAESGESALERVSYRKPDIILLDVRMPGIDGYETCRRLKANEETAATPVIFLSALNDADDKIQGFRAGGVDFIAKPMDFGEVLLRIRTQLSLAREQRDLAASNAELEQRVAARTAQLEEEITRRTQSEAEKTTLLELVRAQSNQLQAITNRVLAEQTDGRAALAQEIDGQINRDLAQMRGELEALLGQVEEGRIRRRLESMERLLARMEHFVQSTTSALLQPTPAQSTLEANPLLRLSEREREVLLLVRQHSVDDIARILQVTPSTVRTYRYRMMQKLELSDSKNLVEYAHKYKLTQR